jgi:hypothetical protein
VTAADRQIEATRYCNRCQREVTVSLEIRADTIRVDCSVCWASYELPRFALEALRGR